MRALMGAIPASGGVEFDHVDLLELPAHRRLAHGVGYMPEDRRLVPDFTVEENIRLPSWSMKMDGTEQRLEWIFSLMPEVPKFRDRRAMELSGGQQKMVALARALMAGRRMLLLDEPFEGLAPIVVEELTAAIRRMIAERVNAFVLVEQHVEIALPLTKHVIVLERGRIVHRGPSAELLADPTALERLIGLRLADA
jgi:branched-chain amino acid transport system ATP-binding protein